MPDDATTRRRVAEARHDGSREWEAFARFDRSDPLRHVGSVSAATAETAHEHAGALFEDAETLWLCPTDSVARFTTRTLAERDHDAEGGGEEVA